MNLWINGEPATVAEGVTIKALLVSLGFEGAMVAVAVNQTFVPRGHHASHTLVPGDRVEIVAPMQGG